MLNQNEEVLEQIKKAKNILVTFNKDWNGDSVASALAMFLFLKKIGKKVGIVSENFEDNKLFSFLPNYSAIGNKLDNERNFVISLNTSKTKIDKVKYVTEDGKLNFIITPKEGDFSEDDVKAEMSGLTYDLVIVIDTPDLESLGSIYDGNTGFFYETPIVNIDHHANNEKFGQVNYIKLVAVSTAEILFSLFRDHDPNLIDSEIATCLLAGMISKTKSFKTENLTPKALSDAAELISLGARREEIVNNLYRSRSFGVLRLWGRVLARLNSEGDDKLIWSALTKSDFEKTETDESDIKEVIDELIANIPQAEVIVIVYESAGKTKAIVYSAKNINSFDLVSELGPKGDRSMATVSFNKSVKETESEILNLIRTKLSKYSI